MQDNMSATKFKPMDITF